jgi:RHS repeat-associated protein
VGAEATAGPYQGLQANWTFDAFGNRTAENFSGTLNQSDYAPIPPSTSVTPASNNQTQTVQMGTTNFTPGYDAAGNYTCDNYNSTTQTCMGPNSYLYDAEGRICAATGPGGMFGYLYDAEGNRVAKGTITSWSCNTAADGFTMTVSYVLGPSNEQLTELDWSGSTLSTWHTNVFAASGLVGTYSSNLDPQTSSQQPTILNFYLTDWLGSRRVTTDEAGNVQATCLSLPYGNGETCTSTPTEHLFTGKERDAESGNDYFGARYYASSMGRFFSPDWSDIPDSVPYAEMENPQTLNLYAYVRNNPLTGVDPDGHACVVQTRTGDNTEQVSVASQGDCSGVTVHDGQSATYVNGTVNLSDISAGSDGHSINIGFTSDDGQSSGVQNSASAPYPDSPNTDPSWGNNAQGYALLGAANTTVKYASIGVAATFGSLGATIVATDLLAGSALTSLGAGDELGIVSNQAANRMIGGAQRELLKEFFKSGKLPEGLSQRTLQIYKAIAQRAIAAGKDSLGVQAQRLQMISNALK